MKRFILTGRPVGPDVDPARPGGRGYAVVDEAATDVNLALLAAGDTAPWTDPMFIERIAVLQRERTEDPVGPVAERARGDRRAHPDLGITGRRRGQA